MLTREEIAKFLGKYKKSTKEEVLSAFTTFCLGKGTPVDKIGKIIVDLQSYAEWVWGK